MTSNFALSRPPRLSALARLAGLALLPAFLSACLLACDLTGDKGKPPATGGPDDTTLIPDTAGQSLRVPGPPFEVLAIAGDARVTVSWTLPDENGEAAIEGYWAGAREDTARRCYSAVPATSCTVLGLENKKTYTFVVRAVNRYGWSEPSQLSPTVVPLPPLLPAPQGVVAVAGRGTAEVSWTAPAPGTWVSVYSPQDLSKTCKAESVSACVVTGLEFGKSYTFAARAHNEVGAGAASAPTAPVTSLPTPPGPPLSVIPVAGDTQATVTWSAPANNGGDSITGYEVSSLYATGVGCKTAAAARSCVVGGLPANVHVSFRVRAFNAQGPGASSAASESVRPFFVAKVPGAPASVSTLPGDRQMTLTWTAGSVGGDSVIRYRVVTVNNTPRCTTSTRTCTVQGLTNGTSYQFTVRAINRFGESEPRYGFGTPVEPAPGP